MDVPEIPTLETERVRLRSLRGSDFEDYATLYADPEVVRLIGTGETWDRGRAWRHMAFALGHWQLQGAGTWVAEEKATGAFVGMIGFWTPASWPGFELSWHLVRRFWGQGYATEAAKIALAHAFLVWQRDHVISLINPKNLPSIRVAERIGERLEGRIEHFGRQMLCYGLDRATYLREVAPAHLTARRAG
jgi:RimJ/RimL family protein N-acetyltransferase